MSNNFYAFFISSIAGISTLIGFLFIYIKKNSEKIISSSLGFASGVMITLSIIDLIPSSLHLIKINYNNINSYIVVIISIFIGIILSTIINNSVDNNKNSDSKLYKIGLVTMIIIMMHNIPEGIATFITTTNNTKLGLKLSLAIALHNIPEGISISIPIYYSTKSKRKAFIYTLVSGMSEPLGAFISYLFLAKYITNSLLGIIYSIIAGMMLSIGYTELYKESIKYNKRNTIFFLTLGIIIMLINHFLFN